MTVECVKESQTELYPVRAALAAIWGDHLAGLPAIVLRTVAQLLPDEAGGELVARYTGATLGKAELFAGLTSALEHVSAKRGTIFVIEDIHWADRTTLEFLAALAPRLEVMRLMIIATCRSEEFERDDTLADVLSRVLRVRPTRHLALQPLQRIEVAELVDDALAGSNVPAPVLAAIIERSEGNPFFAEELLKAAVAQRGAANAELPLSIRASIRHRLATLSAVDRAVLEVAAVLGVRFDHAVLVELVERPPAGVLRTLRKARAANIIDEIDATSFRFHHALMRQTLYDGLIGAEAQALHRRILAAFERVPETEWTIESLAYHASQAGDEAAALRYSERAGDRALERGLFADARSYYERILPTVGGGATRARILERLGAVSTAQGDFAGAIAALEAAFALRVACGDLGDAARIAVALGVERSNSGGHPVPDLEDFLERYAAQLNAPAHDRVVVFLARLMTALGRFERCDELLLTVAAPEHLETRVRANYLTCRLNLNEHIGATAAWRDAANDMLLLAPALPPLMRSIQLTNVAQTGAWLGEGVLARHALGEAQAIAQHWGFEGILVFSRAVEAQLAFLTGDLRAARTALHAVAKRPDVVPAQIVAGQIGPFVADGLDDAALAARYACAPSADDASAESLYCAIATFAHDPRASQCGVIERLTAHIHELAPGTFLPPTVAAVAARHLARADLPCLVRAAGAAAENGNPVALATRDLVRAIVAKRTREPASAIAAAAAEQFHALGWPLFERLARAQGGASPQDVRAFPAPLLTPREAEIASLIASGSTNAGIADRLHIGVKTVEKHVSCILLKLQARSRAQIAAFVSGRASD